MICYSYITCNGYKLVEYIMFGCCQTGTTFSPVVGYAAPRCSKMKSNSFVDVTESDVPFAFTVSWNAGTSVTAWTGHYHRERNSQCNRVKLDCAVVELMDETLFTTWMLVDTTNVNNRWTASRSVRLINSLRQLLCQ